MTQNDNDTDATDRECWLAQTGISYKEADRERLTLTEDEAEEVVDEWRTELGNKEDRWFAVSRMYAVVAATDQPENTRD